MLLKTTKDGISENLNIQNKQPQPWLLFVNETYIARFLLLKMQSLMAFIEFYVSKTWH